MFSVVIADDEPYILQALEKKIGITGLDFHIAATASNGVECLEILHRLQPDLLICDIRMPGLTGLDLMEKLQKEGSPTQVIFVSGYSEFEYARRALELGALGYLLKPVRPETLKETLQKAIARLAAVKHSVHDELLKKTKSTMDFLSSLPEGTPDEVILDRLDCPARFDEYLCLALTYEQKEKIVPVFSGSYAEWREYPYSPEVCLIILNISSGSSGQLVKSIRHRLSAEPPAAAGISETVTEISGIFGGIQQSVFCYYSYFSTGNFRLYHPSEFSPPILPELLKDFNLLFSVRNTRRIHTALDEISALDGSRPVFIQEIMDFHNGFIDLLTSTAQDLGRKNHSLLPISSPEKFTQLFHSLKDMVESFHIQTNMLLDEFEGSEITQLSGKDLINSIKSYIKNNIDADLSLDHLARVFSSKKARISSLFRSETGKSLSEFLRETRVAHACFLLEHTTLPVQEISDLCGIADYFYFAKLFRKTMGVTATRYREQKQCLT